MLWCSPESPGTARGVQQARPKCIAEVRNLLEDGEEVVTLCVLRRPCHTELAPPLDPMAKELFKREPLQLLKTNRRKTVQEIFDSMLLVLWDALFLDQCDTWSQREVANLPADEAPELAKWFLKGLAVGEKPIFDGMRQP